MFNVSKKTLSLVLCLTLIASVVVFCFTGPASAVTTVKYPTYDSAVSLAAKPIVNLTFDGENRYGIPLHRGTGISYATKGFVTSNTSGGWFFVGKSGEAIKDANGTVITAGTVQKGKANSDHVAANYLYELEAGTEYRFVMDYKYLKGSKVAGISLGIEVVQNPNGTMTNVTGSKTVSGNAVVWNVNGAAQEVGTTLESDTDIQTMTATIVPKENGYLALQNYTDKSATIAIDSIKIYNLTDLGSSVQNPISFDNGGVDFGRYMGNKYGYKTDDVDGNSNSYFWYDGTKDYEKNEDGEWTLKEGTTTGSVYFSNYEYAKTWNATRNDSYSYTRMYKFVPGSSYEITFKFRIANPKKYDLYDSRTNGESQLKENKAIELGKTTITPCLAMLPAATSGGVAGVIDLTANDISKYVKDLYYNGLAIENEPGSGIWQTVRICFTLNDTATIDADGLYFGLRGGGFVTEIDDYNVRELINYRISSFNSQTVSFDFDGEEPAYSASAGTVEFPSENGNTYMKYSGGGRMSFDGTNGTNVLKAGNKYYISFDAKSDDGCQHFNFVMGNQGSSSSNYRIFFNGNAGLQTALKNSGSKFYINGEEVDGYTNFKPSSEWQHFGFVLNLDSTAWTGVNSPSGSPNTFNDAAWKNLEKSGGVYFLFGATTGTSVCYDNIKISQFDEIANAVPATDGWVYRDTGTYFNDFNSITTTNLTQNTADKAEVGADASAPERGNIIKILSGGSRLTVNDTNVFEKDYKYTISFDAKLDPDSATDTSRMYAIFAPINSLHNPRYFIMDTGSGCTNPDVLGAFKFYIDGQESTWKDFAIDKNWKTYTIEFDYTNESFLAAASSESTNTDIKAQMKGLSNAVSYFHFGCANGWFDNLKIVKSSKVELKDNTQVSRRQASGSGENYVSAGLRFKNCLPNDVVAAADEVGFVVIPSTMAITEPDTWYKLDGNGHKDAKTVVCKNGSMNRAYERTVTDTYYQLVLTGLSTKSGKTAYNRRFSAVLYVKNGDTYTYHALGETSYNQVGAIKDVINAQ